MRTSLRASISDSASGENYSVVNVTAGIPLLSSGATECCRAQLCPRGCRPSRRLAAGCRVCHRCGPRASGRGQGAAFSGTPSRCSSALCRDAVLSAGRRKLLQPPRGCPCAVTRWLLLPRSRPCPPTEGGREVAPVCACSSAAGTASHRGRASG